MGEEFQRVRAIIQRGQLSGGGAPGAADILLALHTRQSMPDAIQREAEDDRQSDGETTRVRGQRTLAHFLLTLLFG